MVLTLTKSPNTPDTSIKSAQSSEPYIPIRFNPATNDIYRIASYNSFIVNVLIL